MFKEISATLALALAAPLCMPAQAAQQYADFAAASARATDAGYIVFIYPKGWDRYGEKLCRKLIADSAVRDAAGEAALLLAPIYQNRTDRTNAEAKKIMGKLGYPGDMANISYPAIVFYEKEGRQYASLHGRELMRSTPQQVAGLIKSRLAAKNKQDALLRKANAATDPGRKARNLLASARVSGVDWPGGLREAMQKADPGDKHGCLAALNFGFGIRADESIEAMLKRLDAVLANELYTANQKQRACATALGHIRRSRGMMAGGPLITKYAGIMQKLDPDSTLGLSAPVVMRDWVRQYRYGQGWSPEVIPDSDAPVLMYNVPINTPGTYTVNFKITTGRDALHVKKLRLMEGARCVAEDLTPRSVTWGATSQNFSLTIKQPVKEGALEITFGNDAQHKSTWGDISVKKQ